MTEASNTIELINRFAALCSPLAERLSDAARLTEFVHAGNDAIASLTSQAEEIERLRADKARLDFLDRLNASLNQHYGTTYRWTLITNHNVNRLMLDHLIVDLNDAEANGLQSCRDAIDKEMKP